MSTNARMTPFRLRLALVAITVLAGSLVRAQIDTAWHFLNLDKNVIYRNNDDVLGGLFKNLDSLILRGDRQLRVVHFGDSHIQAGFFPDRTRQKLQSTFYLDNGGRGFLFPYRLARTNNPLNYSVSYTGAWETCRNVDRNRDCDIGLSGMTAYTNDVGATVRIDPNNNGADYIITRVKVFHRVGSESFEIELVGAHIIEIIEAEHFTEFVLFRECSTVELAFARTADKQTGFELHGLSLESEDPGIVYSSVGVNGADATAFLRSNRLVKDIESLEPNLVVISLGANDAYFPRFSRDNFEQNMRNLVTRVRQAAPYASIILTTPGDGFRRRRYPNRNYSEAREAILQLARTESLGVWDFFDVMGGEESVVAWYRHGLATYDKLHLTREGYWLQGDLFYEAIMKAYHEYLEKKP